MQKTIGLDTVGQRRGRKGRQRLTGLIKEIEGSQEKNSRDQQRGGKDGNKKTNRSKGGN